MILTILIKISFLYSACQGRSRLAKANEHGCHSKNPLENGNSRKRRLLSFAADRHRGRLRHQAQLAINPPRGRRSRNPVFAARSRAILLNRAQPRCANVMGPGHSHTTIVVTWRNKPGGPPLAGWHDARPENRLIAISGATAGIREQPTIAARNPPRTRQDITN